MASLSIVFDSLKNLLIIFFHSTGEHTSQCFSRSRRWQKSKPILWAISSQGHWKWSNLRMTLDFWVNGFNLIRIKLVLSEILFENSIEYQVSWSSCQSASATNISGVAYSKEKCFLDFQECNFFFIINLIAKSIQ